MSALLRILTLTGPEALTTAQLLTVVVLLAGVIVGYCIGRRTRTETR